MKNYIEYIEVSCADLKDNGMTRAYKKKLIDEMTVRANEITHAGIKDENVVADIIADEFGDLKANYPKFVKEEKSHIRSKKLKIVFPMISLIFLITVLVAYFYISRKTGAWNKTWLIITGGVFLILEVCAAFAVNKLCHMRRTFHPFSRIVIAFAVMLMSVYAFLVSLIMLADKIIAWPIILIGVLFVLVADLIFAYYTKQKFRTISFLVYTPAIAAILYVILASYGIVSWATGWTLVLVGVIADLFYLLAMALNNMKYFMYDKEGE